MPGRGGAAGRRLFLGGALAAGLAPWRGLAQPATAAHPRVALQTGEGLIELELFADQAPITSADFLAYVDAHLYDGATIYRALRTQGAPTTGLIQGGARPDAAHPIAPIAHESTRQTGLSHKDGTLSLARRAPGTATSDFFICVGDAPYLDADPTQPGDNLGFAAFGRVTAGMDVARRILALATSPTLGAPEMPARCSTRRCRSSTRGGKGRGGGSLTPPATALKVAAPSGGRGLDRIHG